ncbi:MAG TPA: hypothetical protein VM943_07695 [Pyrinomonadaceae bacterium]|nr:hypothetical protein [Pyrinomonadaceae bacterium]
MKKQVFIMTALGLTLAHAPLTFSQTGATGTRPAADPPAQPTTTAVQAQTPARQQPTPTPPQQQAQQTQTRTAIDLSEYGVYFDPDPRLIVVMAALDAAGFDPVPAGAKPSAFREMVRRDNANLDPVLRGRLRDFYERYKLKTSSATPAEQAARYVSLAYALGAAPGFEAPARSDDLPSELLEVLDFSSLVREYYRQSGIADQMPEYLRAHREAIATLRPVTAEMVRATLSYLHTRPQTSIIERVPTSDPARKDEKKKKQDGKGRTVNLTREKQRRFLVVPDLLGAPGATNFRIIGDDYYAIVPPGIAPTSSDLRRAYLQYIADPLVSRFNRDISARRAEIKQLLDERRKTNPDVSPDVFLAVSRSLVAAADARMNEAARRDALARRNSIRLQAARNETERAEITKESQAERQAIEDTSIAQLAESYERGAVLSFFFAEQLRGLESSGFDVASFFGDMMSSFNATREGSRPGEYATARARHVAAREKAKAASSVASEGPEDAQRTALFENLEQVDELLRLKNYTEAETRLRAMLKEFQGEPRIFFALAQAASLSAQDAFEEDLQRERLSRALSLYEQSVLAAAPDVDSDKALISRARAARGRIYTFLDRRDEALKEFDAVLRIGPVRGGAYTEAQARKQELMPPK